MSETEFDSSDGQRAGFASQPGSSAPPNPLDLTYRQAVTEARALAKRSNEDQWRLAELTWMEVKPQGHATQQQWAQDIGLSRSYVGQLAQTWDRYRLLTISKRPGFTEALATVRGLPAAPAERTSHEAVRTIKTMAPEKRAAIVRQMVNGGAQRSSRRRQQPSSSRTMDDMRGLEEKLDA